MRYMVNRKSYYPPQYAESVLHVFGWDRLHDLFTNHVFCPPAAQWLFAQIFPIQKEEIKGKIDQRHTSRAFEYLEKLERRAAFLIERGNFAVEDNLVDGQKLERIN